MATCHHPHLTFTDGTYDGRYLVMNDKANTRVARIRLDVMKCDKIIELPNQYTVHGLRLQKAPRTGYIFANGEYGVPLPNDGKDDLNDPTEYWSIFSAIDVDTMEVALAGDGRRQSRQCRCRLPGQVCLLDLLQLREGHDDRRDDGQRAGLGRGLQSQAHRGGREARRLQGDERRARWSTAGKGSPLTRYIPISNGPHGINTAPDGIHFTVNGKLSPTVTVIDVRLLDQVFDDKLEPRGAVVAEPELGLGPLHTAYDGRGNAYTTLFLDSQVCKWNIDLARRAYKGEQVDPILQKLDVHYQPGHNHTSMGQTKEADGKWLISLNKFSKDRFLNVGPLKPENDQLIDISGDKMVIVHDGPSFAEPHDATIVHRSKINPVQSGTAPIRSSPMPCKQARPTASISMADAKVIRDGNKVRVYM